MQGDLCAQAWFASCLLQCGLGIVGSMPLGLGVAQRWQLHQEHGLGCSAAIANHQGLLNHFSLLELVWSFVLMLVQGFWLLSLGLLAISVAVWFGRC